MYLENNSARDHKLSKGLSFQEEIGTCSVL